MEKVENIDQKAEKAKKKLKTRSMIFLIIQGIFSLAMIVNLFIVSIIPTTINLITSVVLVLCFLVQYRFLVKSAYSPKPKQIISIILSLLLILFLGVSNFFLSSFYGTITNISRDAEYKTYTVRVLSSTELEKESDVRGELIGVHSNIDEEYEEDVLDELDAKINPDIKEYGTVNETVNALFNNEVVGILVDESDVSDIEKDKSNFLSATRVVVEISIEIEDEMLVTKEVDVTDTPYNILISGTDTSGTISSRSKSDANMLVTINPKTSKILLTSIPRDYYVNVSGTNEQDKLTHVGNEGMPTLVTTVEELMDVEINYYIKVNFDTVEELVDSIDGITVNSDYEFSGTGLEGDKFVFNQGENTLTGEEALAFMRERDSVVGGDEGRIQNQQIVLSSIMEKIISNGVLSNYTSILRVISDNVRTDMPPSDITDLLQKELLDPSNFSLETTSLTGEGDSRQVPSYEDPVYVMIPDEDSLNEAKDKINSIMS